MGIPYYFSYIIKNYSNIIRNLSNLKNDEINFEHLYMDCNSIIYDSVHLLEKLIDEKKVLYENNSDFEELVIKKTIEKIYYYIDFIKPEKTIFIAFDGVAPFAKMKQQRERRYKSNFLSKISINNKKKWNTSAITPGTEFMNKLSVAINKEFFKKEKKNKVKKIIISCSKIQGEGEHKIYENIRENNNINDNIFVYGLDADLIMLSIFHLKYSKNIYVFKETPEFLNNIINFDNKKEEIQFLDIQKLCNSVLSKIDCKFSNKKRIDDYVFLCFFLGNDFLPHFPAMNIRTHGIDVLLEIYKKNIGNYNDRYFISENGSIQWKYVKLFIKEIANREHQFLINEYNVRKKFDKYIFPEKTDEEKNKIIMDVPIIYREKENYICPYEPYWENRYYFTLFDIEYKHDIVQNICINYLEGLEWVYKYYTNDCKNWSWYYKYNYPPLFIDLCKFIPNTEKEFINIDKKTLTPYQQLCYVLPKDSFYLLPKEIEETIIEEDKIYEFEWSFCRYFWESHIKIRRNLASP